MSSWACAESFTHNFLRVFRCCFSWKNRLGQMKTIISLFDCKWEHFIDRPFWRSFAASLVVLAFLVIATLRYLKRHNISDYVNFLMIPDVCFLVWQVQQCRVDNKQIRSNGVKTTRRFPERTIERYSINKWLRK